jgi:uncharacterized protein (TIGR02246 family)
MRVLLLLMVVSINLLISQAYSQNVDTASSDEEAIQHLISQYLETRAQGNEEGLLALLTEDIDQRTTSGNLRSGRDEVSSGSLASTRNNSGTRSIAIETIRFIQSDVAIADGLYDIVDRENGPDLYYRASFVVLKEENQWRISAIRNMQPTQQ